MSKLSCWNLTIFKPHCVAKNRFPYQTSSGRKMIQIFPHGWVCTYLHIGGPSNVEVWQLFAIWIVGSICSHQGGLHVFANIHDTFAWGFWLAIFSERVNVLGGARRRKDCNDMLPFQFLIATLKWVTPDHDSKVHNDNIQFA